MDTTKAGSGFFAEFPPVSKEEWLQKIAKDLKDKSLEDMDWHVSEHFAVSPFAHADDFSEAPRPFSVEPNRWEICEDVAASDPVAANREALAALEGGAEGLRFCVDRTPDAAYFSPLLDGIHLDYIGLHFSGKGVSENPGATFAALEQSAKAKNIPASRLRGSLDYDPLSIAAIVDWRYLADLTAYAREKFPGFRLVTVNSAPGPSPDGSGDATSLLPSGEGPGAELTSLLQQGNRYLDNLVKRGVPAGEAAGIMQFSIAVGPDYFLEIARIRAFKILWLNILKAWNAPLKYPPVAAYFRPDAYTDELYTNMIRATTMAMSAALGGADRLTVRPYDAGRETKAAYPQAFSRRIARNVQHLLKLESGFDRIADPAAGSYYIEKLTRQLAEKVWEEFGK